MDARVGRFMGMDQFDGDDEDPSTLHRYVYASDEPNDRLDPSGNDDFGIGGLGSFDLGVIADGSFGSGIALGDTRAQGSIVVSGSFANLPNTFSSGEPPQACGADADACTEYLVDWMYPSSDPLSMTMKLKGLHTTYFHGTGPTSPNALNGTLGKHENAHKTFARAWWTTGHVQQIAVSNRMQFIVPDNKDQADTIGNFLYDLHAAENERFVDQDQAQLPVFNGIRY
jgi:hypothetical protein